MNNLHAIGTYGQRYGQDHVGPFPRDLHSGDETVLLHSDLDAEGNTNSGPRYYYVDWGTTTTTNILARLPIAYDRRSVQGGITLLLGSGDVFWDEDASWLTASGETNGLKSLQRPG